VPDPAYVGAGVLSVRRVGVPADVLSPLVATPALDELVAFMQARKAESSRFVGAKFRHR
jgi:hypothetical protein